MCVVQFENMDDKMEVMRNKKKLRDMKNEKAFIDNDLTEREIQGKVRQLAAQK